MPHLPDDAGWDATLVAEAEAAADEAMVLGDADEATSLMAAAEVDAGEGVGIPSFIVEVGAIDEAAPALVAGAPPPAALLTGADPPAPPGPPATPAVPPGA